MNSLEIKLTNVLVDRVIHDGGMYYRLVLDVWLNGVRIASLTSDWLFDTIEVIEALEESVK